MKKTGFLILFFLIASTGASVPAKYLGTAEYLLHASALGPGNLRMPANDSWQTVSGNLSADGHGSYVQLPEEGGAAEAVVSVDYSKARITEDAGLPVEGMKYYTLPSKTIPITPEVNATSELVTAGAGTEAEAVARVFEWVVNNVRTQPVEGFPDASQVLEQKQGECREKAILFIALLRAKGIPARYVSGLLYSNNQTFLHAWAEAYFPGTGWVPFDLSQAEAVNLDAGHVKLWASFDPADVPIVRGQEYSLTLLNYTQKKECYSARLSGEKTVLRGDNFTIPVKVNNKCPFGMGVFRIVSGPWVSTAGQYKVWLLPPGESEHDLTATLGKESDDFEQVTLLPGEGVFTVHATGPRTKEGGNVVVQKLEKKSSGESMVFFLTLYNQGTVPRTVTVTFKSPEETLTREVSLGPGESFTVQQSFQEKQFAYSVVLLVAGDNQTIYTTQLTIPAVPRPEIKYSFTSALVLVIAGVLFAAGLLLLSPYVMKGKKPFGGDVF